MLKAISNASPLLKIQFFPNLSFQAFSGIFPGPDLAPGKFPFQGQMHGSAAPGDAVRILLTRVAREGSLPVGLTTDPVAHDIWFRSKIKEALEDSRHTMPHDEVEAHFEARRNKIRHKKKDQLS